jgi:membrane peptidoglycan carboxypeptidase
MLKWLKRILWLILLAGLVCAVFITANGYKMYRDATAEKSLDKAVEELRADEDYVTIDELPQMYLDAVVAIEDHRYYDHGGIDLIAIGRAVKRNIKAGALVEGGSTITQQVGRNFYFTQDKLFSRKMAEVFVARNLEKNYSKDEILELYVNMIFFGEEYTGIREASIGYFGKEPVQLNDYESTLLAGIPNAPNVYAPTSNPSLANQRHRQVLDRMVECEYLSQEQADEILSQGQLMVLYLQEPNTAMPKAS